MTQKPSITIRNGRPEDWGVLRLLLPDSVQVGSGVATVVAEDGEGFVHGALAVQPRMRSEPVRGAHVAMHVIEESRGQGLAKAMFNAIDPWAAARGAKAWFAWGAIEQGSAMEKVWRGLGFDQTVRVQEGRVDPAAALTYLTPIWEAMVARGKIPSGAQMTSLAPEHAPALMKLHLDSFGGDPAALALPFLPESPTALDPAMCPVLTLDGVAIGYALTIRTGRARGRVDATAVVPAYRSIGRGWANLWLKREGMLRCAALGLEELTFYTYERHGDTRRFTEKNGSTMRTLVEPYRLRG